MMFRLLQYINAYIKKETEMNKIKKMYIGGELVAGNQKFDVVNPANDEVTGTIAWAGAEDATNALLAAEQAFKSWSTTSIETRITWMHKLRDAIAAKEEHLCECIHLEMGKSWASAQEDFSMLIDSLNFYADSIRNFQPTTLDNRNNFV